jgi:septum formation protein
MIYLASASPQRQALLQAADLAFTRIPSDCDEAAILLPHAHATAVERARAKARQARMEGHRPAVGDVILAADTVVSLNGRLIGKPADRSEAKHILADLAGTTHTVATAHCCRIPGAAAADDEAEAVLLALSRVTMRAMTLDEIEAYVASGESDGRAGAYAIQESGDRFVVDLQGEFDTVVGLNITSVRRLIEEINGSAEHSGRHRIIDGNG